MIKLDIQHLILSKYKNQAAFAEATDLSLPSVSKICSGNMASIRFETLEKICEALECTPNDLLTSDKNEWDTKIPSYVTEYIDRMEHISQEIQDATFRYRAAAYHKKSDD